MAGFECARCHRIFNRRGLEEVCLLCLSEEETEFSRIKEFLTHHPGATSSDLINELNVSLKAIKRYLREDRMEIIGQNKGFLRCDLCGKPINSGRFCDLCYKEGQASLRNEAGLGIKSAYIKPNDSKKGSQQKGIQYHEDNKDKRR